MFARAVPRPLVHHRCRVHSTCGSSMMSYWDQRAPSYDSGPNAAWHARIAVALFDAVAPQRGERLLDVGCGTGLVAVQAARLGARVTGLDASPQMLSEARTKAAACGVCVSFLEGDAQTLDGFSHGSFDVITASALVPFLPDPPAALRRWRDVLCPGGRLVFHGFHDASCCGALSAQAAASVGVPVDFERHTGSARACEELLQNAGFERVSIVALPITNNPADAVALCDAKKALPRLLTHPLYAQLAEASRADASLLPRLQAEFDRLVDESADEHGRLRTNGQCFIAIGHV